MKLKKSFIVEIYSSDSQSECIVRDDNGRSELMSIDELIDKIRE